MSVAPMDSPARIRVSMSCRTAGSIEGDDSVNSACHDGRLKISDLVP
jgi:hypothetical protein